MRQRLSSEPDRYRGRRRVPTPPRSRYAAVVTTAFVGAGVVAFGAGAAMPDAKAVNPSVLADLERASVADALADRTDAATRASRADAANEQAAPDVWLLPVRDYSFTSPFGVRWGRLHQGIDLAAPEGRVYSAMHDGVVKYAGFNGGYGWCVIIDHGDGVETLYGHSSRLLVKAGQRVRAGDSIGLVGNTGYSTGPHLHLEIHVDGVAKDPIPWLRARGVDVKLETEAIYAGQIAG